MCIKDSYHPKNIKGHLLVNYSFFAFLLANVAGNGLIDDFMQLSEGFVSHFTQSQLFRTFSFAFRNPVDMRRTT